MERNDKDKTNMSAITGSNDYHSTFLNTKSNIYTRSTTSTVSATSAVSQTSSSTKTSKENNFYKEYKNNNFDILQKNVIFTLKYKI